MAAAPDFWNDRERAQTLLKEQAQKRAQAEGWKKQKAALDDAQLSFAFNYLGPTGNQRDEVTVIRRRSQNVEY